MKYYYPYKSDRPDKKYYIITKDNNKMLTIFFFFNFTLIDHSIL